MFAIRLRVSPCSARSSPRSVGRVTVTVPSDCSTFIRAGTCCVSSASGPLTITRPGKIETLTPLGSSIGCLPIRLIRSPDEAQDFAADSFLLGRPARDEAVRRGQDRHAHSAEHARQAIFARVNAAAGLRDALQ